MSKSSTDTLRKVHHLRNAVALHFQEKWDSAKENARFYRLLQYSDPQLKKIQADHRVPYVLDYVTNAINTYLGVQRDQRTDLIYLPKEKDDEVRVEVLNSVKDSTMQKNDWLFTESDIFQDGIIEKAGFVGYEWSTENNPMGELKLFRIPPRQMSWDINRRDASLNTAQWVSRTRLYPKRRAMELFPEHAKLIEKLTVSSQVLDALNLDESYLKQIIYSDLDSIALIEFYERNYYDRWFIVDGQKIYDDIYKTKKDAEADLKDGIAKMLAAGANPQQVQSLGIKRVKVPVIEKSEVLHYEVLTDTEQTDLQDFPYDVFHPYWHDGEYWGVMDTFKDAQRFINKMFLSVDEQISKGSKGLLLIDNTIPETKANQIISTWSTTGGAMRIRDPKNNIQFIPPTGFDPRLLSAMDVAIVNLEKKAGGANFLGHKETASESGIAVRQRIEQGSLSSFLVYDNFTRFKKKLGKQIMWYLSNYMTAAQKIRLEGKELTEFAQTRFPQWFEPSARPSYGFLTINTEKTNSLESLEADVIVDEAKHSVTKNQMVLNQISTLMQSSPLMAETIPPQMVIELTDLPATVKEKWMNQTDQLVQAKMEKDKAEAQKPPTLSASLKDITILPPTAQAQFASLFGIQLDAPIDKEDNGNEETAILELTKQAMEHQHKSEENQADRSVKILQMKNDRDIAEKEKKNAIQK